MTRFRIKLGPRTAERARKLRRLALWGVGGGGLVAAVFFVSFYMALKAERSGTEIVVPDLTGLSLDEAGRVVDPLALVTEVVDRRHDPSVASGRILQQQPRGGSRVRRGRKLKLVLSLGGRILTVPDLVGKANRAVEIELRRDGFTPGDLARVHDSEMADDRVLAQVPPAGSPGVPASRVHRLISAGPRPRAWVMPDLRGVSRAEAERWIDTCGFRSSTVRKLAARGKTAGTVIGQLPLAGYPIHRNAIVELTVAR